MAYDNRGMSVIAYSNGFTLWRYMSETDTIKDICEPNYFCRIAHLAAIGDILIVNAKDGTVIKTITQLSPTEMEIGNLS